MNTTYHSGKQRRRDTLTSSLTNSGIAGLRDHTNLTLLTTEVGILTQVKHIPAAICAHGEVLELSYAILG